MTLAARSLRPRLLCSLSVTSRDGSRIAAIAGGREFAFLRLRLIAAAAGYAIGLAISPLGATAG